MSAPNRFSDQAGKSPGRLSHVTAAGLLAVAGGLHLAALPSHLNASTVAGAFFAVTAAAQLLGAVLVVTRPSARTIHAVVAGNVAVLILWAMSRTTGLPTGGELGVQEPFGLLDGMAAAAEILVVAAGARHHAPRPEAHRPPAWRLAAGARSRVRLDDLRRRGSGRRRRRTPPRGRTCAQRDCLRWPQPPRARGKPTCCARAEPRKLRPRRAYPGAQPRHASGQRAAPRRSRSGPGDHRLRMPSRARLR